MDRSVLCRYDSAVEIAAGRRDQRGCFVVFASKLALRGLHHWVYRGMKQMDLAFLWINPQEQKATPIQQAASEECRQQPFVLRLNLEASKVLIKQGFW